MENNLILSKLEAVKKRYEQIAVDLTAPDIMSDVKKYVSLNKEYKSLTPIIEAYDKYRIVVENLASAKEILQTEKDE